MIESAVLGIALLSLVPVWIIGVITIAFLCKRGYASIKAHDAVRTEFDRLVK